MTVPPALVPGGGRAAVGRTGQAVAGAVLPCDVNILADPSFYFLPASARRHACPSALIYGLHDCCILFLFFLSFYLVFLIFIYSYI